MYNIYLWEWGIYIPTHKQAATAVPAVEQDSLMIFGQLNLHFSRQFWKYFMLFGLEFNSPRKKMNNSFIGYFCIKLKVILDY